MIGPGKVATPVLTKAVVNRGQVSLTEGTQTVPPPGVLLALPSAAVCIGAEIFLMALRDSYGCSSGLFWMVVAFLFRDASWL